MLVDHPRKIFALACAILLLGAALAIYAPFYFSPSSHNNPKEVGNTSDEAKNAETQIPNAKRYPFFVEIIPSDEEKKRQRHETEHGNEKAYAEKLIAGGTIALAFVTLCLVIATIGLAYFTWNLWRDTVEAGKRHARDMEDSLRIASNAVSDIGEIARSGRDQSASLHAAANAMERAADAAAKQVKETKRVANVTRDALITGQRAFVFAQQIRQIAIGESSRTFKVVVEFKNGGPTAARQVCFNVSFQTFAAPISDDFAFADVKPGFYPTYLGPQQTLWTEEIGIPESEIADVIAGRSWMYFWGWVEYNDTIPHTARHRTEFCFRLIFKGAFGGSHFRMAVVSHNKYNGADEDCMSPATHLPEKGAQAPPRGAPNPTASG